MTENPRNPEFPGDMVGRPEDEKEQAKENFQIYPEITGERPTFPGETAEERSKNYWRKVRNTSEKDESRD